MSIALHIVVTSHGMSIIHHIVVTSHGMSIALHIVVTSHGMSIVHHTVVTSHGMSITLYIVVTSHGRCFRRTFVSPADSCKRLYQDAGSLRSGKYKINQNGNMSTVCSNLTLGILLFPR